MHPHPLQQVGISTNAQKLLCVHTNQHHISFSINQRLSLSRSLYACENLHNKRFDERENSKIFHQKQNRTKTLAKWKLAPFFVVRRLNFFHGFCVNYRSNWLIIVISACKMLRNKTTPLVANVKSGEFENVAIFQKYFFFRKQRCGVCLRDDAGTDSEGTAEGRHPGDETDLICHFDHFKSTFARADGRKCRFG